MFGDRTTKEERLGKKSKQKWQDRFDEEFGGVIYSSGSFEQEFLKDFITKLLKEQREEIIEKEKKTEPTEEKFAN